MFFISLGIDFYVTLLRVSLLALLQLISVFDQFSIFSKYGTSVCKVCTHAIDQIVIYINTRSLMQKCMMLYVAHQSQLAIFIRVSFRKTIETKIIFFYKLCSFRNTSNLKIGTVYQSMITFTQLSFYYNFVGQIFGDTTDHFG